MSTLRQPLTMPRGTAVILNIVIGAGLLTLPGLAIRQAGELAFCSWILCGLVSFPLLAVLILLGRRYPNAGGIAHFARIPFGSRGYGAASLVFLGAVIFGIPSIALTGGHYASVLVGESPHAIALALLCFAMLIHLASSEWVARANSLLAAIILCTIIAVVVSGLWLMGTSGMQANAIWPQRFDLAIVFSPFMMIFFAFTGWEVAAGLSEEFRSPARDFPRAMVASFVVVVLLYLAIAYLVQHVVLDGRYEVAFTQIAAISLGTWAKGAVAVIATVIILANLSGAIWAVSRLVFSLSREGWLPAMLQKGREGTPWLSVLATSAMFVIVLVADWAGFLGLERMLALAGQNFIVLYGIAAAALFRLSTHGGERLLAGTVVCLIVALVLLQGIPALYSLCLLALGMTRSRQFAVA